MAEPRKTDVRGCHLAPGVITAAGNVLEESLVLMSAQGVTL
jgi:hypothetical protein